MKLLLVMEHCKFKEQLMKLLLVMEQVYKPAEKKKLVRFIWFYGLKKIKNLNLGKKNLNSKKENLNRGKKPNLKKNKTET